MKYFLSSGRKAGARHVVGRSLLATVLLCALAASGCSATKQPAAAAPAAESVNVAPVSVNAAVGGATVSFTATIKNGSGGVIWQVNGVAGGDSTVGTISPSGTYTSPATMPASSTVTITAEAANDNAVSGTASVSLVPPGSVPTVSVAPLAAKVAAAGGSQAFVAVVGNASNSAVTWSVNGSVGGDSTVGTISASGLYMAPATVPAQPTVTVTATSVADTGVSASAQVTIIANATVPPTISGTPQSTASVGSAYSFTPTASSPRSGATLTFTLANGPTWASFNSATGALTGTPGSNNVGATSGITISVDDGTASASLAPFTITVIGSATPPTISGTPPTSVAAGSAYAFTPTASTPRIGSTLTFSISNAPSWATFNASTGQLSGTPTSSNIGTYANVIISVSDGTASASLAAFTITVNSGSTGSATLTWTAPTTRTDGSTLTNLAGFNIYYGTAVGNYGTKVPVPGTGVLTYVVSNLPSGTYYFVATAYDANGIESAYTNPVSTTIP